MARVYSRFLLGPLPVSIFGPIFALALLLTLSIASFALAEDSSTNSADREHCLASLRLTARESQQKKLESFCDDPVYLSQCLSKEGRPIFHMQKDATSKKGTRILALGLIHGDEPPAGEMTLDWAERLKSLKDNRSTWRVVPMLNPDGLVRKTRMNADGVDLNRNFPTRDWNEEAVKFWEVRGKKDPRRFPGIGPASEPETKCVIAHIKDFKPEIIVSNHIPYRVLDFDGPKIMFPHYRELPWRALGNFPGSLGRYMWKDNGIPVLTIELGNQMVDSAALQDLIGTFAIEAVRKSGPKKANLYDLL